MRLSMFLFVLLLAGCATPGSLLEEEPKAVVAHSMEPRALVECVNRALVLDGLDNGAQAVHSADESILTQKLNPPIGPNYALWVLRARSGSAEIFGGGAFGNYQGQILPPYIERCDEA